MVVGILLLDQNDNYVTETGALPPRPAFDKRLLTNLVRRQRPLVSENTLKDLPPSIVNIMDLSRGRPDVALSPAEIDKEAHLLIISRSRIAGQGKKFRMDKFQRFVIQGSLELWIRRDK